MKYNLSGRSIIGRERGVDKGEIFRAVDPRTNDEVGPDFVSSDMNDLDRAAELAAEARHEFAAVPPHPKAEFLRAIAANIESLGSTLIDRASLETALTPPRLENERTRTCFQLRMFANLVEEGSWVEARIDHGDSTRQPVPKPDLRSMLMPIGPVAVFCASNFPLAYSVAGGDTASAFAAGCPVIVNAHSAHPGTAELVGLAVAEASADCGMPAGVFSLLFSKGYKIGQELVRHGEIKAVGFTGSRSGGRALMDIAAARPEPITVYAEMSSINPTFILPSAAAGRSDEIAARLHSSFTTGGGQFCTKPGLIVLPDGASEFAAKLTDLTTTTANTVLLTPGIREHYERGLEKRSGEVGPPVEGADDGPAAKASVFHASAETFLAQPDLANEIFGPTTLLITAGSHDILLETARALEGQLTASIFGTPEDLREYADLVEILKTKAGRLIFNGVPTGVEVGDAIVHGGPYPATSDSRTTSVGTRAITRFARYVCCQAFPDEALPAELQNDNPMKIMRMIDGVVTSAAAGQLKSAGG